MVPASSGRNVATSITSAEIPSSSSVSATASVSLTMAPQVTSVTSSPWRSTMQASSGSASPSSGTSSFRVR